MANVSFAIQRERLEMLRLPLEWSNITEETSLSPNCQSVFPMFPSRSMFPAFLSSRGLEDLGRDCLLSEAGRPVCMAVKRRPVYYRGSMQPAASKLLSTPLPNFLIMFSAANKHLEYYCD